MFNGVYITEFTASKNRILRPPDFRFTHSDQMSLLRPSQQKEDLRKSLLDEERKRTKISDRCKEPNPGGGGRGFRRDRWSVISERGYRYRNQEWKDEGGMYRFMGVLMWLEWTH